MKASARKAACVILDICECGTSFAYVSATGYPTRDHCPNCSAELAADRALKAQVAARVGWKPPSYAPASASELPFKSCRVLTSGGVSLRVAL